MGFSMINIIPGVAMDTNINANVFISEVGYYVPLVIKIYYDLNGAIGLNVFNISLVYLLLA